MKRFPWFGTATFLIGLGFGYYWYLDQNVEIDPTFISESIKQNILSKELVEKAPIKIIKASGEEIQGNVYSQTFFFFNQGKKSIKPNNVLEPLFLTFSDSTTEIIDYRVLRSSREATKITLKLDSLKNSLLIEFRILEEDDGLVGQIIYVSKGNPELILKGVIEGATKGFSSIYKRKYGLLSVLVNATTILIFIAPFVIIFFTAYRLLYPSRSSTKKSKSEKDPRKSKLPLWYWLTTRYQLIIRNEDDFAEKSSVGFQYYKIIGYSAFFFALVLIISLLLARIVLNNWFDLKNKAPIEVKIPESLK